MTEEKKGIKEIGELIEGLGLLAKAGFKISKDGKVDISDLAHLVEVVKEFDTLMDAFEDLSEIGAEIKDLDESEVIIIIGKLFKVIKEARE